MPKLSALNHGLVAAENKRQVYLSTLSYVFFVFPDDVPVRQWVLSLPINIRYRLAYDGKLLSEVLSVFLRVVRGWYRQQKESGGF